jgi:Family of unknown function (DUF5681)
MNTREPRDRPSSRRGKLPVRAAHEVGYGRPPRAHQFKPGRSGNPRGRPRGAKNEATILRDLLDRKIEVRQGGRSRKITVFEAILMRFTEDALKGNTKSASFLLSRHAGIEAGELRPGNDMSDDDRKVLDAFARRFEAQPRHKGKKP